MRLHLLVSLVFGAALLVGCGDSDTDPAPSAAPQPAPAPEAEFQVEADRFADIRVLRYRISGWETLSLKQKQLLYYLTQAGMSGRDIMWDQNYRHNLRVRRTLEEIVRHYPGDRTTADWNAFMTYAKRIWFANGIHHHYAGDKFVPGFSSEYFRTLAEQSAPNATWPLDENQTLDALLAMLDPIMFDPTVDPRKTETGPRRQGRGVRGQLLLGRHGIRGRRVLRRAQTQRRFTTGQLGVELDAGEGKRPARREGVEGRRPVYASARTRRVLARAGDRCRRGR
jgi:hypothetical protein